MWKSLWLPTDHIIVNTLPLFLHALSHLPALSNTATPLCMVSGASSGIVTSSSSMLPLYIQSRIWGTRTSSNKSSHGIVKFTVAIWSYRRDHCISDISLAINHVIVILQSSDFHNTHIWLAAISEHKSCQLGLIAILLLCNTITMWLSL